MSQEINNELELIRSILRGYKPSMARDDALYATARVKRLVGQDRAQRGEPVAWRAWFDKDSGARWLFSLWPDEENKGLEVDWQPLYTAPQPERKPMSDVKAYALAGAVFPYSQHAKCLELIRDVESHHGIKP